MRLTQPGQARRGLGVAFVAAVFASACAPASDAAPELTLARLEFKRPARSGEPHLAPAADGRALLTWLEQDAGGWSVRLAVREDGGWTDPRTVRTSDRLFVNWADFPSAVEMADGTLAVHWLEKVADATYAYHVMLALSSDGGLTWTEPFRVHDDDSPTEHGFVSMVPWDDGAAVVWLDGRAMASWTDEPGGRDDGAMSMRFRTVAPDGTLGPEVLLDDRTCECCQTTLARGSEGLIAAYRDRSMEEVRDIAVVRGAGEQWSEPTHVSTDEWTIRGCPVNGPQLSAAGQKVAAAWYTGAGGDPQTYVAFSEDGGATFGTRIRFDEGVPLGRVDIERLDDGSAIVVWLEASDDAPRVLARRVRPDGTLDPPILISQTSGERVSGFPRMIRIGSELLFAWTLPDDEGGVRVRSVKISD